MEQIIGILELDFLGYANSMSRKMKLEKKPFDLAMNEVVSEIASTKPIVAAMNDNQRYELTVILKKRVGSILGLRPRKKKEVVIDTPTDYSKWKVVEMRERSVRFTNERGVEYCFIREGRQGVVVTSITGSMESKPPLEAIRFAKMKFDEKPKGDAGRKVRKKTFPRIEVLEKEKIFVHITKDYGGTFVAGNRAEKILEWRKGTSVVPAGEVPSDFRKEAFGLAHTYFVNLFRNTRDLF